MERVSVEIKLTKRLNEAEGGIGQGVGGNDVFGIVSAKGPGIGLGLVNEVGADRGNGKGVVIPIGTGELPGVLGVVDLLEGVVTFDKFKMVEGGLGLGEAAGGAKNAKAIGILGKELVDRQRSILFCQINRGSDAKPGKEEGFGNSQGGDEEGEMFMVKAGLDLIEPASCKEADNNHGYKPRAGGNAHEYKPELLD